MLGVGGAAPGGQGGVLGLLQVSCLPFYPLGLTIEYAGARGPVEQGGGGRVPGGSHGQDPASSQ